MKFTILLLTCLVLACLSGVPVTANAQTSKRGMMTNPNPDAQNIIALRKLGANLARWQLTVLAGPAEVDSMTLPQYQAWIDAQIRQIDAMLPVFAANGISVVLDLHTPPGGFSSRNSYPTYRMFHTQWAENCYTEVWKTFAMRYRNNNTIWGFDILNEPCTGNDTYVGKWRSIAEKTAKMISGIDPNRRIIVESPYGDPRRFTQLRAINVPRVIYSFHMYAPDHFTHQGLYGRRVGVRYPGVVSGRYWDATTVANWLRPVVEFQKRNDARIYVGEFSAVCYAPGRSARNYLEDLTGFFEKQGWNWTYHAFREWEGWSVEHIGSNPDDIRPANVPTDRLKLLKALFSRNR